MFSEIPDNSVSTTLMRWSITVENRNRVQMSDVIKIYSVFFVVFKREDPFRT